MIRTACSPDRALAAVAALASARAVADGLQPRDPIETLAWAESGEPFRRAGLDRFLDLPELPRGPIDPADAARLVEASAVAARRPETLGAMLPAARARSQRRAGGQFDTPAWVAERVLDLAGYPDGGTGLLDPMCGSGVFLMAGLRRLARRRRSWSAARLAAEAHGIESDPLAALAARAGVLITLAALRPPPWSEPPRVSVLCADAILAPPAEAPRRFAVVAGNPPWVGWESLSPDWRKASLPLWRKHGLFADTGRQGGMQVLLGRGRKDLSMLATYVAAEEYLDQGGTLAFVLPLGVLKSVGSGAGFRRFLLGSGTPLEVVRVEELRGTIFRGAAVRPIILTLRKGGPTRYPVAYAVRESSAPPRELVAEPVDRGDPTSAWLTASPRRLAALRCRLGRSHYTARAGAFTGGANGVYWVRPLGETGPTGLVPIENDAEAGRRRVPRRTAELEVDLIFPLLRAGDVAPWRAVSSGWILLPQDPVLRRGLPEKVMRDRYPRALRYLTAMEEPLRERRDRGTRSLIASGAPLWSVFSVSEATFAPWKVVWPRIASSVVAAVVGPSGGRPVVPQETCTFIACGGEEEACYLAGLLNSSLFQEAAAAFGDRGGKSFGAPHLLRHIAVPRFAPERPQHAELARMVMLFRESSGPAAADLDAAAGAAWVV